jgi:hypothetical protein
MADIDDPRPGDLQTTLLRKILNRLGILAGTSGSGSGGGLTDAQLRATAVPVQGAQAQDASPSGSPQVVAAELADPTALPANGTAGKIRRVLAGLKGQLLVQQGDLSSALDSVTIVPGAATTVNSVALEASHVLKATPGSLMFLHAYNNKGSAQFIQLHDATSLPANGAVPKFTISVPTVSGYVLALPASVALQFTTGIVVANSSTGATLTTASADCYFTAVVI